MESIGIWLTPLLFMPGVALLILSTSARYSALHQEMHHFEHQGDQEMLQHLFGRGRQLRNALLCFYIGVTLLLIAALVGGVLWMLDNEKSALWSLSLIACCAILAVVTGTMILVRESWQSLVVLRNHLEKH